MTVSDRIDDAVFLLIDCQTSGATPRHGPMIEASWVFIRGNAAILESRSFLIKPVAEFVLPKNISRLTGLSCQELQSGRLIEDVKATLDADMAQYQPVCAIAHFARFEQLFFNDLYRVTGFPLPFLCTHSLAKRMVADIPSYSIRALAAYFGHETAELKRSAHHAAATLAIWRGLCGLFSVKGWSTTEDLRACLSQPALRKGEVRQFFLPREKRLGLPVLPGVYQFLSSQGEVLYVGKATSLRSRVNSYFRGRKSKGSRLAELLTRARDVAITEFPSPLEAALYENHLIKVLMPPYNAALKRTEQVSLWTDRSFWEITEGESSRCAIGPFPDRSLFEALHGVYAAFMDDRPAPVVYGLGTTELSEAGMVVLRKQWQRWRDERVSLRSLVAWALREVRFSAKATEAETQEGVVDDAGDAKEDFVLTPEFIAQCYQGLFLSFARLYLRAKKLKVLQNATVLYKTSPAAKGWRLMTLRDGSIVSLGTLKTKRSHVAYGSSEASPLLSLSLGYDGMRVLLTELGTLQRKGGRVAIKPISQSFNVTTRPCPRNHMRKAGT